ncbi:ABC transporter permease [Clostridiaceae bacterium HSG29]|nr:ABC transporter permease [Clostridiaceae bacterium HSG29]
MFQMIKRAEISKKESALIRFSAIVLAFIFSGLFILLLGHNPVNVYISMFDGAFGSLYRLKETIIITIPLVITSIGIMIAFKMKFWNIGGEGQILMGAFGATVFALNMPELPKVALLSLMLISGFISGGLWALIPAIFKVKFGTNETIITLMLNYIAIKWITHLQYGPMRDPNALGFPKIANFSNNAILPSLFGVHIGWIFAVIIVIAISIFMKKSKWGYKISVIGESVDTARYAGININRVMLFSMFLSGGICGIAGMIEASAVNQTLNYSISAGYGFTAIITTWLSGLMPSIIIPVSLLFGGLVKGGNFIQTAFLIPKAAAQILQSMILFFAIGSEFFVKYKLKYKKRNNNSDNVKESV